MKRPSVLIVGYGVVGGNLHRQVFPWAEIHDPAKGFAVDPAKQYDVALICVPTPNCPDGTVDLGFVLQAVMAVNAKVTMIKSTVPPGTTKRLSLQFGKRLVFSPEFEGETLSSNAGRGFWIFGGEPFDRDLAAEAVKHATNGECRLLFTDTVTAELCKYMDNSFLALKVSFCNEFYRVARRLGVDYNELREAWLLDPRVGRSHTYVFEDAPYWESKCLDKDVPAIVNFSARELGQGMALMEAVLAVNSEHKRGSV